MDLLNAPTNYTAEPALSICGMDLIPTETGERTRNEQIKMTENAMALANIQTTIVAMFRNDKHNSTFRKIMANEEDAVQASYFEGRIEKLNQFYG